MMMVARKLVDDDSAKLMFVFCSLLPIRLELRMTKAEEVRMGRPGCSNSCYRREEVHRDIQLEG